jgi:hypothetical protein
LELISCTKALQLDGAEEDLGAFIGHSMSRQQDTRIRDYILQHVEEFPGSIASRTAREFGFTRTGILRYINRLIVTGVLVAWGTTKARRYELVKNVQPADDAIHSLS